MIEVVLETDVVDIKNISFNVIDYVISYESLCNGYVAVVYEKNGPPVVYSDLRKKIKLPVWSVDGVVYSTRYLHLHDFEKKFQSNSVFVTRTDIVNPRTNQKQIRDYRRVYHTQLIEALDKIGYKTC